MQWHCHSGRLAGGGGSCHHGTGVSWLPGTAGTHSLGLRLAERGQGLTMGSKGAAPGFCYPAFYSRWLRHGQDQTMVHSCPQPHSQRFAAFYMATDTKLSH